MTSTMGSRLRANSISALADWARLKWSFSTACCRAWKRLRVWWKCRDGFRQARARQIDQQTLEEAEGPAGLEGLVGRLHGLESLHPLDENKRAPAFAVPIAINGFAVAGGHNGQAAAGNVPDLEGFEFARADGW